MKNNGSIASANPTSSDLDVEAGESHVDKAREASAFEGISMRRRTNGMVSRLFECGRNLLRHIPSKKLGRIAQNPYIQSLFLFTAVFISRLPFCTDGCGTEPDAYRVVSAGRHMSGTLDFVCCRPPCHPIPVITYAILQATSCTIFNIITAFLSAAAALAFAVCLRSVGVRHHLLAGAVLASVPMIYINSTNSMDYIWALCFAMVSVAATVKNAPIKAGVALGLSAGCRLEYGALLLPILIYIALSNENSGSKKRNTLIQSSVSVTLAAGVAALLSFVPVLRKYGIGIIFNKFKMTGSSDDAVGIFLMPVFRIFGGIGAVVFVSVSVFALCEAIISRETRQRIAAMPRVRRAFLILCLVQAAIFGYGYLRAPFKAAYLIPSIPFFIGFLAVVLEEMSIGRRVMVVGFIVSLLSPFLLDVGIADGVGYPYDPAALTRHDVYVYRQRSLFHVYLYRMGPVLRDAARRAQADQKYSLLREHIRTLGEMSKRDIVVVTGAMGPRLEVELGPEIGRHIILVETIKSMKELEKYRLSNRIVCYLSGVDRYNKERNGIDLKKYGAFLLR